MESLLPRARLRVLGRLRVYGLAMLVCTLWGTSFVLTYAYVN
jgi:hypothetical protein